MLGDLDLMQCAQKDAPTMRRLSMEITSQQGPASKDLGGGGGGAIPTLRRVSCSSVSSTRSSMSQDSTVLSPTLSSSMPNSFYLDRVSHLLGRTTSLPMDRAAQALPSIPSHTAVGGFGPAVGGSPPRPPALASSAPTGDGGLGVSSSRASALIRSLSRGMDSFR